MSIYTHCPACQHELQVPPELMAQLVKCPMCGKTFTAPATVEEPSETSLPPVHNDPAAETLETAAPPSRRPRSGFSCPYCHSDARPVTRQEVSLAGWIVFAVLLVSGCLPLFWIGLLMKDDYQACADCGRKLGGQLL